MPFCSYCGNRVEAGERFCTSCGRQVEQAVAFTPAGTGYSTDATAKFRKKLPFLALLALVLVAVVSVVFLLMQDSSPKQTLLAAEKNTRKAASGRWDFFFGSWLELQQMMMDKPFSTTMEIGLDVSVQGRDDYDDLEAVRDLFKNSKLRLAIDNDSNKGENLTDITVVVMGADLIDAQLYWSADQTGFQVPVLYDRYFYLYNNEFEDVMERFYLNSFGSEAAFVFAPMFSLINYTHPLKDVSGLNDTGKKYLEYLVSGIKNEHLAVTSNVSYSSPEGEVKVKQITLTMSAAETEEMVDGLLDIIEADDHLFDLIYDNFVNLSPVPSSALPIDIKAELKKELQAELQELRGLRFPDGFHMMVLLDDRDRIVKREVNFTVSDQGYIEASFRYTSSCWWKKQGGEVATWLFEFQPLQNAGERMIISGELATGLETNIERAQFEAYAKYIYSGAEENLFALDVEMTRINSGDNSEEVRTVFALTAGDGYSYGLQGLNGRINQVIDQNLKQDYHTSRGDITLQIEMENWYSGRETYNLFVDFSSDTRFKKNLDFPDLNREGAVNLATVSDSELSDIMSNIERELEAFFLRNSLLFTSLDLF